MAELLLAITNLYKNYFNTNVFIGLVLKSVDISKETDELNISCMGGHLNCIFCDFSGTENDVKVVLA
jgi:hypothetical protein